MASWVPSSADSDTDFSDEGLRFSFFQLSLREPAQRLTGSLAEPVMRILECKQISKRFGALEAVRAVSFSLGHREILSMIGPNGAGKTTLFNCIIGLLRPDDGRVIFDGTDITGMKPHRVCRLGLAKTSQIMEPFRNMTVFENVLVGALYGGKMNMAAARREAQRVIEFVGLADQSSSPSAEISVPACRRLELARSLATGARVLLLDESMAGLNPSEIEAALDLLRKIRDSGKSLVIVEHVIAAVTRISDRIIVLNYGAKIADGSPEAVLNNHDVLQAYLGDRRRAPFSKVLGKNRHA
jgi:branched-chain amino acid transport system ATP-binding protein